MPPRMKKKRTMTRHEVEEIVIDLIKQDDSRLDVIIEIGFEGVINMSNKKLVSLYKSYTGTEISIQRSQHGTLA